MNPTVTAMTPYVSFLDASARTRIYETALKILNDLGMHIQQDEALHLLKKAGCPVSGDTVQIPRALLERSLASAPANIPVYNRQGHKVMDLGGRRAYFGTGSDLIFAIDNLERTHRVCTLEDVARAARVCDALPNIDFIMSFASPSDIAAHRGFLMEFWSMAANSVKPIVCTADGRRDLNEIWEIAAILCGGEASLRKQPYVIHYAEPISPLKHPVNSLDKLLLCAEKQLPLVYSPAPIAGSTAPMTIAGHIAQGLAECLCGLVIHQLKSPGAPFLMGMGAAVLDMATSQCSYNAPEYYMAYMGMIEMSHHLDLPSWGYAGTSDSQIPDEQAVFEAGVLTYLAALAGANLNHDVGYLDFGRTGSLEMIVVCDEIIDQVRRVLRGIVVDEDTLALEVIREAAAQGEFLTHPHTYKHVRATQWRPKLICRQGYEDWLAAGSTSLLERAHSRLNTILAAHQPEAVDSKHVQMIETRLAAYH